MKNLSLIIILFAVSLNWSFGQTTPEPIRIDKVTGGYSYYHKGDNLGERGLSNILKQNDKAYRRYKAGKNSRYFSILLQSVGGAMIGWPLGTYAAGGDPNWTLAGIGAGIALVSIPIFKSYDKKTKEAVIIYNHGLQEKRQDKQTELELSFSGNGVGLNFSF